jgi:putative hydrolase of the HAD superfamily
MPHTIFFDLDNTLYSKECGIWEAISERIDLYMKTFLNINEDKIQELRSYFRQNFATSYLGLNSLYTLNENEYFAFVHDIDLSNILSKDNKLHEMLSTFPQRKIIFTNSDIVHAKKVLDALGVRSFFDLVIDVMSTKPFVKPHEEAFFKALSLSGLTSSEGCVFVDDLIENVDQASEIGFLSILIGDAKDGYLCIQDIFGLPDLLSSLN